MDLIKELHDAIAGWCAGDNKIHVICIYYWFSCNCCKPTDHRFSEDSLSYCVLSIHTSKVYIMAVTDRHLHVVLFPYWSGNKITEATSSGTNTTTFYQIPRSNTYGLGFKILNQFNPDLFGNDGHIGASDQRSSEIRKYNSNFPWVSLCFQPLDLSFLQHEGE